MNPLEQLIHKAPIIEAKLGYIFRDKNLLALSFVHRSFFNENRYIVKQHNERLEFLGDAILGLLISDYLYRHLPSTAEGELSYLRSRLVESNSCVTYIQKLNISQYLLLGKGEQRNDGRGRDSILADLFEALVGAIYLDGSIDAAQHFIFKTFSKEIENTLQTPIQNWKALLQDYTQKKHQQTPVYKVLNESGPDHSKNFCVTVEINQKVVGIGKGSAKKEAQQAAAEDAILKLTSSSARDMFKL